MVRAAGSQRGHPQSSAGKMDRDRALRALSLCASRRGAGLNLTHGVALQQRVIGAVASDPELNHNERCRHRPSGSDGLEREASGLRKVSSNRSVSVAKNYKP